MDLKDFIYILRRKDGTEYNITVSARNATDALRRLKNLLSTTSSKEKIVSLINPQTD